MKPITGRRGATNCVRGKDLTARERPKNITEKFCCRGGKGAGETGTGSDPNAPSSPEEILASLQGGKNALRAKRVERATTTNEGEKKGPEAVKEKRITRAF